MFQEVMREQKHILKSDLDFFMVSQQIGNVPKLNSKAPFKRRISAVSKSVLANSHSC